MDNLEFDTNWSLGSVRDYEAGPSRLIEPGTYVVEFIGKGKSEEVKKEYDPEGRKKRAPFYFRIVEDRNDHTDEEGNPLSFVGRTLTQYYTISLHEKSKLRPVVEALMGGKLDPDAVLGPGDLIGRRCVVTIQHAVSRNTGATFPVIAAALPLRPSRRG